MRALVIAHEPDGPATQIEVRLVQRGFSVHTHIVTTDYDQPNVAAPFPDTAGYDIIVPMGSVRSLVDKHKIDSWIHAELSLLRDAHNSGTPILGVCFGGQLIAEALGGSVERAPVTELGWYEIEDGPEHSNPVGPGPWMEWHHDRFIPPPGADVLALTADAVQLIRIDKTVGTQFHPEVDVAHVAGFLAGSSDDYLAEFGANRVELLEAVRTNEANNTVQCHALVDWFLDDVAFPNVHDVSDTS